MKAEELIGNPASFAPIVKEIGDTRLTILALAYFWFCFTDCDENIFVDLEKSTEDILYCYDYMVVGLADQAQGLTLE